MPTPRNLLRRKPEYAFTEAELAETEAAIAARLAQIVGGVAPPDDARSADDAPLDDAPAANLESAVIVREPEVVPADDLAVADDLDDTPRTGSRPWVSVGPGVADETREAVDPAPAADATARAEDDWDESAPLGAGATADPDGFEASDVDPETRGTVAPVRS